MQTNQEPLTFNEKCIGIIAFISVAAALTCLLGGCSALVPCGIFAFLVILWLVGVAVFHLVRFVVMAVDLLIQLIRG